MPDTPVKSASFSTLERVALAALAARLLTPYRGVHIFDYRADRYWRFATQVNGSRLRVRDFERRIEFVSTGSRLIDLRSSRSLEVHHDQSNVVWLDPRDRACLIATAIGHAITVQEGEGRRRDAYYAGITVPSGGRVRIGAPDRT